MKKIYLFIFLIVIGLSQNQSVKANTSKLINAKALNYRASASKTTKVTSVNVKASKKFANPVITFGLLGTKQFSSVDVQLSASSTATVAPPITFTSSNPAVATVVSYLTFGAPTPGSGYTNGTYNNVPLSGGTGTGEYVQIVVANGVVTTVTPSVASATTIYPQLPPGSGYSANDVLTCPASYLGGTGSGFSIVVATVTQYLHMVSAPAPPNNTTVITATQGGGTLGNATLPADVPNVLTVTAPTITFPTLGTKAYSSQDIAVGATSTLAAASKIITYTSSNPAVATINNILTGVITVGTGYTGGTYYKVPLTGGSGTGATATIVTASSAVSTVTATANGGSYAVGDVLTCSSANIGGAGSGFVYTVTGVTSNIHYNPTVPASPNNTTVITASQGGGSTGITGGTAILVGSLVNGTGYTNGIYQGVALTGGTGTGAKATVTVTGGVVTAVVISSGGSGYIIGDILSCASSSVGGTGTGFTIRVANTTAVPADVSQTLTVTQPAINFPPLGVKQFTSNDLNPGATGVLMSTNSISTLAAPTPGTGYTNGTYYAVALTGGTGTGATATITVIGGVVTSVIPVSTGAGYVVGDFLTTAAANIGGTGSGFQVQVTAVSTGFPLTYTSSNPAVATIVNDYIHFVGVGSTTITASQNGPTGGTTSNVQIPTPVSQILTVVAPAITLASPVTKILTTTDASVGGSSTLTNIPIKYTSSNTSVATVNNSSITGYNNLIKGTGYTTTSGATVYNNVPLVYANGSTTGGSGATATVLVSVVSQTVVSGVVVSSVNGITSVIITSGGSGYTVGDVLTVNPASVGGTGTGFSITVSSINSLLHMTGVGTTTITASQGGGAGTGSLPADVTQALTITAPVLTFPALGNQLYTTTDLNPGATSTLATVPITYTSSNTAAATILSNSITSFSYTAVGAGYAIGTYSPVPLIYANGTTGTGTGAMAQIGVVGGSVTIVNIISGGTGYNVNDILTADPTLIGAGTTGKGFNIIVGGVGGAIHFVGSPASPNNSTVITASQAATGGYPAPPSVQQTLTVSPFAIVFPTTLGTQVMTSTDMVPGATSTLTTVPITYTSSNTAVATIVGGNIHFIGAGSTVIKASQQNSPAGTVAAATPTLPADATQTLTVTAPKITFPTLATAVFGVTGDITPAAISNLATTPVTYSSNNTAVATIVNGNIHIVSGPVAPATSVSAVITASQGGGAGTVSLPADATTTLTVTSPTITLPAIGAETYTDVDYNPGATSTSPLAISYASSNSAVATIVTYPTFASPLTSGNGYVNGTYTAVPLIINGTPSATATATIVVSGGMVTSINPAAGVTLATGNIITCLTSNIGGGSGSGFSATVNGSQSLVHYNPAVPAAPNNTAVITASQSGVPSVSQTLTLSPPLIRFAATNSIAYTNIDFVPAATSTVTKVPLTYTSSNTSVATIVNGQIHIVGMGSTNIEATQQNSPVGTIKPVTTTGLPADVVQVLTVTNSPAITFSAINATFGPTDITPVATSNYINAPITYTSSNTNIAQITANGTIHMVSGPVPPATSITVTITASQGGGSTGTTTLPADKPITLTISSPAITFPTIATTNLRLTDVDYTPVATSTITNTPITFTSSDPTIVSISPIGALHFVKTGQVTITASQGGGSTGTATLPKDVPQQITVTAPLITFAALGSKPFAINDFALTATSTLTGTPITFTSSNPAVASVVFNGSAYVLHYVSVSSTSITITASQGGGTTGTSTLPADVTQSLTVTAPAITFAAIGNKPFSSTDLALTATSSLSTAVPITYSIPPANASVATIVNNAIHYVGTGTNVPVTASQGGGSTGTTASVLTVGSLIGGSGYNSPGITNGTGSGVYTGVQLTGGSGTGATATITVSNGAVTTVAITPSGNGYATGNVLSCAAANIGGLSATGTAFSVTVTNIVNLPADVTQTLAVTAATFSFTAIGTPKVINSGDVTLAATVNTLSTTTYPMVYTTSDPTVAVILTGGILHYIAPGTVTVTASQPVPFGINYGPAPLTQTIVITAAAAPTIATSVTQMTFTALSPNPRQYTNQGDITPAVTGGSGQTITFSSSNPAVATIVNGNIHLTPPPIINGVVTYPVPNTTVITASQGGGVGGVPGVIAADVSQTLTVTPASITFAPLGTLPFNTDDLAPGATSTFQPLSANNVPQPITYTSSNPAVATIVNGNIHFVGLGLTTITASLGNVIVQDVSQTLLVTAPVITFPSPGTRSVIFSTADQPNNASSTLGTVPITYTSSNLAVVSIVNGNLHFNSTGVVTITASQLATGNSTAPASASQLLTVTGATGVTATGTLTFPATRTQAFSLTDLDPGATSTITTVPITYTSSNPALVSIVNNKLHFNLPASPAMAANTVVITATQAGVPAADIPTQTLQQTLTITPIIIAQTPLTKMYGDPDFSPAISTTGLPVLYVSATVATATQETAGVSTGTAAGQLIHIVAPGTSAIATSQPADAVNTTAPAAGSIALTVVAAPLTITPKNITVTYGTPIINFPLNYDGLKSPTGGFPLDDSTKFTAQPVVSINGKSPNGFFGNIPVGTYQLTASGAAATLYSFNYGTGTLTIAKATQTLTWTYAGGNINKSISDPNFDPLARSTGDPILYTSSNPAVATIVNGQVHIVGVGQSTITATLNPTSGNYTGSATLTATLNVGPGSQTITVANIPGLHTGDPAYTPTATASSNLPVTMVSSDPTIVKVVGTTLVALHVGTVTITFSQPGNASYSAAPNVTQYVQVTDPNGRLVKVDQAVSPNGDGINDFLYVEGLQNYPSNHVKIINRNGDNVYEVDGYNNKDIAFTGKSSHNGRQLPEGTYFYLIDFNIGGANNHITGYFVLKY